MVSVPAENVQKGEKFIGYHAIVLQVINEDSYGKIYDKDILD